MALWKETQRTDQSDTAPKSMPSGTPTPGDPHVHYPACEYGSYAPSSGAARGAS